MIRTLWEGSNVSVQQDDRAGRVPVPERPPNGECYKAFTAGPCRPGQFLIPHQEDENIGQCVVNPCPRAHLYFPAVPGNNFDTEVKCHKVGQIQIYTVKSQAVARLG